MSIDIPVVLQNIPNPPKTLYTTGVELEKILHKPRVAIVGSRKVSTYGKIVTTMFADELARQGVVIVSGLAFGVDALAHTAALQAKGLTIAVMPTGLDTVYPSSHQKLAEHITQQGALVTEYPEGTSSRKHNFIDRNRLISGLSDAVLITEAAAHSGTLHTARHALEQGKKIFAVPGNITSPLSKGTNQLVQNGAQPVTAPEDILKVFGLTQKDRRKKKPQSSDPNEQIILDLLYEGVHDKSLLLHKSGLDIRLLNQALTMLEISGSIKSYENSKWSLL